jgi:hypothetical protein
MQEIPRVTYVVTNAPASHRIAEKSSSTTTPPPPSADVTPPFGQIPPHKSLNTYDLKAIDARLQKEQFLAWGKFKLPVRSLP